MTFMRKFLDVLNMNNWSKKNMVQGNKKKGKTVQNNVSSNYMTSDEWDKVVAEIGRGIKDVHNDIASIEEELEDCERLFNANNQKEFEKGLSLSEADAMLQRANELAEIANKTTDREKFYNSINEIKSILRELSKYEDKLSFIGSPSSDLKNLEQIEKNQIELLEKRIAEKEKASNRKSEVLYHDRFDEDYREVNSSREITFNGRNFGVPEVKLCAAILLSGNQNGSKIRSNDHYSLYFAGRYGLMNVSTLHRWLYEQGYLRKANLPEALSLYKVSELKMILESLGLKKSGNKSELIERIIKSIGESDKERIVSQCEHLFLTEKGYAFLEENGDYDMWHRKSYGVTFEEFNKHRILQGRKRKFHDTIFQALNEKAFTYQSKQWFSKLEMIYFWLGESLYDEGRYDLAIRYYIYRLYFSANLASHPYFFNLDRIKDDGVEKQKWYIRAYKDTFNSRSLERIAELREYYHEQILDIVYDFPILPYCIFNKTDMADAIHDLLNEEYFDAEHYKNYICIRYENYMKQFL